MDEPKPAPIIQWQWIYQQTSNQVQLTSTSSDVNDERLFELHQLLAADIATLSIARMELERAQIELLPDQLMLRLGQMVICTNDVNKLALDNDDAWFELDSRQHVGELHGGFMLMSEHLRWHDQRTTGAPWVLPDIPIIKLLPNQHLVAKCYCAKNNGLEHGKWSPIGGFVYSLASPDEGRHQTVVLIQPTGALTPHVLMRQLEQRALRLGHLFTAV